MSTRPRRLAVLLVSALFLGTAASATPAPTAVTVSLSSARAKAAREGKLLLVDFTAAWCLPCKVMAETTFADPTVLAYLREHYVAIEIDVENFDGLAIQQQYEVETLPAVILFASDGQEVDRLDGAVTAEQLLIRLRQNNLPQHRHRTEAPAPEQDWTEPFARVTNVYAEAEATETATRPPLRDARLAEIAPSPTPNFKLAAGSQLTIQPTAPPTSTPGMSLNRRDQIPALNTFPKPQSADGSTTSRSDAPKAPNTPDTPQTQTLYRLQLGAFTSEANALQLATDLSDLTDAPPTVSVETHTEQKLYRVTVGTFASPAAAETLRQTLAAAGLTGIVRAYLID